MKLFQSKILLLSSLWLACSPASKLQKQGNVQNATAADSKQDKANPAQTPAAEVKKDEMDEVVASEPVPIGGAFMVCFMDYSLPSDSFPADNPSGDRIPVGCALYEDKTLQKRADPKDLEVTKAKARATNLEEKVTFYKMLPGKRWDWVTHVPANCPSYELVLEISSKGVTESKVVPIYDSLPIDTVLTNLNPNAIFDIRLVSPAADKLCLRWLNATGTPATSAASKDLQVGSCDDLGVVLGNVTDWRSYSFHQTPAGMQIWVGLTSSGFFSPRCLTLDENLNEFYIAYCSDNNAGQIFSYSPRGTFSVQFTVKGKEMMFEPVMKGKVLAVAPGTAGSSSFELKPVKSERGDDD